MAERKSWLKRRIERKDATFEAWVAQQGTQFLPTNSAGWPIADVSQGLAHAVSLYDAGPSSYAAIYRSQPSVFTVVDFLSRQMSQLGLKVYKRTSDTDRDHLQDSPITALLAEPAPGLTYTRLIHRTVADLCIYGNCYWLKLEPPLGINDGRRSLVPLPVEFVTVRGGSIVSADSYELTMNGQRRTFPFRGDRPLPLLFPRRASHGRVSPRATPSDHRGGSLGVGMARGVLAEVSAEGRTHRTPRRCPAVD